MVDELVKDLHVRGWEFRLLTVDKCRAWFEGVGIPGTIEWSKEKVAEWVPSRYAPEDLIVRSNFDASGRTWSIQIFKSGDCYLSAALLEVGGGVLVVQLMSDNANVFGHAQRELAAILKALDLNKVCTEYFEFGTQKFTSSVWREESGRLVCKDGVCNVNVNADFAQLVDTLMQHDEVLDAAEGWYYKFRKDKSVVQILQRGNVVFYAICAHARPLYEEIKEVVNGRETGS